MSGKEMFVWCVLSAAIISLSINFGILFFG